MAEIERLVNKGLKQVTQTANAEKVSDTKKTVQPELDALKEQYKDVINS